MTLKERILIQIKSNFAFKSEHEIINHNPFVHTRQARKEVKAVLRELEKEGKIIHDRKGHLCTPKQAGVFSGTVRGNARGFAFVEPDDKEKFKGDFFIPPHSLFGAYDGDKVKAAPVKGTADEAYIVEITERGRTQVVGVFMIEGGFGVMQPDDSKLPEIAIPLDLSKNAKDGDKVLCEITSYPQNRMPNGKVIEVLGEGGNFAVEVLSIIRAHGLYSEFPEEVIHEAEKASSAAIVIDGRRDLREKLIFTIDGADTRDIDDAVSLEYKDGKYILGVHIADVSNYVKYRSAVDNEAYARGTSVYFPDAVLPMLPKSLSNGACSLNEGEDRYAMSCVMIFDERGNRLDYEIFESVIKSRRKMTYSAVTAICNGEKTACNDYADLIETVALMQKLCLIMESRRDAAGNVNLDVREAKIYTDASGKIVIPDYERTISERIIEQFMISANEAVAEFMAKRGIPCLYRIHEVPSPEKVSTLVSFLKDLGINAKLDADDTAPADFQRILKSAENKPYFSVINKVMLRCMQKARYAEENRGHFGLASSCYCHFTSPIRRYPDLFVHRALKEVLRGGNGLKFKDSAKQAGIDCSECERNADEAEREVDDLYKLEYMTERIGEEYDATVSGVTNFGVFCELKNTVEGLIPLEYLPEDNYEFFGEKFLLKGRRNSYRLGDKLKIRVDGCDFGRKRVTFSIAQENKL
ncbi:MAG: ribonuclease R [Clostridia bacterium]|nr:ribonuclease R [Clostridia bacterium]